MLRRNKVINIGNAFSYVLVAFQDARPMWGGGVDEPDHRDAKLYKQMKKAHNEAIKLLIAEKHKDVETRLDALISEVAFNALLHDKTRQDIQSNLNITDDEVKKMLIIVRKRSQENWCANSDKNGTCLGFMEDNLFTNSPNLCEHCHKPHD